MSIPRATDDFLGSEKFGARPRVHPEAADSNAMRWRLFRIMMARAHAEDAAENPDHTRTERLI
jgi:hypothetical protein